MELISTTKTYHDYIRYEDIDMIAIIVHYDGTDMNLIRITIKDLNGNEIEDEIIEQFVQSRYIEYCITNDIPHE